jgi:hypothetical protein
MTMPPGWTALSIGANDTEAMLQLLGASNPDLASLVRGILDLTQARPSMAGASLRDLSGGVPPNVTVLIQPSGGLPVELVGPLVEQLVKRVPGLAGTPSRLSVSLPAGNAALIDYQVVPSSGGPATSLRTYVLVRGNDTFLVTFTVAADRVPEQQPIFDGMIDSLRFTP